MSNAEALGPGPSTALGTEPLAAIALAGLKTAATITEGVRGDRFDGSEDPPLQLTGVERKGERKQR